jgi:hypothetical protein
MLLARLAVQELAPGGSTQKNAKLTSGMVLLMRDVTTSRVVACSCRRRIAPSLASFSANRAFRLARWRQGRLPPQLGPQSIATLPPFVVRFGPRVQGWGNPRSLFRQEASVIASEGMRQHTQSAVPCLRSLPL